MNAERLAGARPAARHRWPLCWPLCALLVAVVPPAGAHALSASVAGASAYEPACANAAGDGAELTFTRALRLAMCGNTQLAQAGAAIARQVGEQEEVEAAYYPVLNASIGRTRDQQRLEIVPDSSVTTSNGRITMDWKLFDFGERDANVRSAVKLVDAALRSRDATLQTIVADLTQSYFDAVSAVALATAKRDADALAAATLQAVERRTVSGMVSNGEVEQATAAGLRASLERNRAGAAAEKAQAALKSRLKLPLDSPLRLPDIAIDGNDGELGPLRAWLASLPARHPAIAAAQLQADAAKAKEQGVRVADRPSLSLSVGYYRNGRPEQSLTPYRQSETTVGLAVSIPIFDGFAHAARLKQAHAEVMRTEAALTETTERTSLDVASAYADAASALDNVALALKLTESTQRALASVRRRYDKGVADTTELLTAQAAFIDAADERIRCLSDWRNARLRLLAASATYDLNQ